MEIRRVCPAVLALSLALCSGACDAELESFRQSAEAPEPARERPPRPIFYELWRAGGAGDQSAAPVRPDHSALVAWAGADVSDEHLAGTTATPALKAKAELIWVFSQCFGGGMIDELAATAGKQVIATASRYDERAYYRIAPQRGVGRDWLDAYLDGLAAGKVAREIAAYAAEIDPFGPNPGAARARERAGSEHPQFYESGAGAAGIAPVPPPRPANAPANARANPQPNAPANPPRALSVRGDGGKSLAILWSGQPHRFDGEQIDRAIDLLVTAGYSRDRIVVLYGSGRLGAKHDLVRKQIIGKNPPVQLRAATRRQVDAVFRAAFAAAARPEQVFFLANDHGSRSVEGRAVSQPRVGDQQEDNPVDADAYDPDGEYGDGDASEPPEFAPPSPSRR